MSKSSSSKCNKLVISWPQNLKQLTDSSATCSTWQQKAGRDLITRIWPDQSECECLNGNRNRNRSRNRIWLGACSAYRSLNQHKHTHRGNSYYWKNSHFVCRRARHVVNMWERCPQEEASRGVCCCISFTYIVAKHDVLHIRVTFAAAAQAEKEGA